MLRVCFNCYGNYTTDKVYQWDQNHTIKVMGLDLDYAPAIHFCNKLSTEAIVVHSEKVEDGFTAPIPNILLQEPYNIFAYVHIYDVNNESAKTIELVTIPLVKRIKPSEYEFIDNSDIMNFERLETDIADFIAKVTADFEEHKEYVESLVYKPNILFNTEDFVTPYLLTTETKTYGVIPYGAGVLRAVNNSNSSFKLILGEGLQPQSTNTNTWVFPLIDTSLTTISEDNPITVTLLTNKGVVSGTITTRTAVTVNIGDGAFSINRRLIESDSSVQGIAHCRDNVDALVIKPTTVDSTIRVKAIKAEYSPVFTGFAPKPYERYLDNYYSNQYSDANLEMAKAYTDTTAIEVMKSENLLFNADFAYNCPLNSAFNGVGDPGLAGWETLPNVSYKPTLGLLVTPDVGGPFLVQWLDNNTGNYGYKESGYLTIEWSTKTDTSTINTLVVPIGADKENYISSSLGNSFTLNSVDMQVYLTGTRFHLQIPTPVTATDANTTYIRSLKYEANDKATPIVHSSVESARLEAIADHVDARVSGCLTTANSYADAKANNALTNAKTYANTGDTNTLNSAKAYVQAEIYTGNFSANYEVHPNDTIQNCLLELHDSLADIQQCACTLRYGSSQTAFVTGQKYNVNVGVYLVMPRSTNSCYYMRVGKDSSGQVGVHYININAGATATIVYPTALA